MRRQAALAFGSVALYLACLAGPVQAATQVGVAAAVRGNVKVAREAAAGAELQSGEKLYLGDKIHTGPAAGLQILLLDETVFTLGPDSEMTIDTFVYDPASADGKLDAKLVKGAFRFISGKVARRDPRQMNVTLPSGTIGIRGTIVFTRVDPITGRSVVVLSGPGSGNSTGETAGAIEISNAGVTQEVLKSGWGVEVPGFDQPPTEPFEVPADFFDQFDFDAAPVSDATPSDDSGEDGSSGEGTESASSPESESGARLDPANVAAAGEGLRIDSTVNTELPLADPVPPPDMMMPPPAGPVFTPTTIADLTTLSGTFMGHYLYVVENAPLDSGGNFDLTIDLDFSEQVVAVDLTGINSMPLDMTGLGAGGTSTAMDNRDVLASYTLPFQYNDMSSQGCSVSGCSAQVLLLFENKDAQIAGVVSASVAVTAPLFQNVQDGGLVDDFPITTITP